MIVLCQEYNKYIMLKNLEEIVDGVSMDFNLDKKRMIPPLIKTVIDKNRLPGSGLPAC